MTNSYRKNLTSNDTKHMIGRSSSQFHAALKHFSVPWMVGRLDFRELYLIVADVRQIGQDER
jgi:hypothetical protein